MIELMIAMTIMLIAVVVAGAVIMAGVSLSRSSNQLADQSDWSRDALDTVVDSVSRAGYGAPGGVYVDVGGGTGELISPVYGDDNTGVGGSDDLWMVVADRNADRDRCYGDLTGGESMTVMAEPVAGTLTVACTGSFAVQSSPLPPFEILVSNMNTAALLTVSASSGTTIGYNETGISDAPDKGGFQVGDIAYRAEVVHYFIKDDANGSPGLYRETGVATGTVTAPFKGFGNVSLVQNYVEDFQVKYATDTSGNGQPLGYTWSNGLAPQAAGKPPALRAVRLTVVVRSSAWLLDNNNQRVLSSDTQAPVVENHDPGSLPDGYRRVIYTRTVELNNLAPETM